MQFTGMEPRMMLARKLNELVARVKQLEEQLAAPKTEEKATKKVAKKEAE